MRVFTLGTLFIFSFSRYASASSCNGDNCLNAMKNHPISASSFCAPFLATTQTATSGIPSFLSNCQASISRLSSACSCILASTANTATSSPQISCTATTTITVSDSAITTTVTSGPTCPSTGATSTITSISISTTVASGSTCPSTGTPNTITSVSVSTTTVTVTATTFPTCFPHINGGDFTSSGANLNAFIVTQDPPETILNEVLATSAQSLLSVTDGTTQFLFLNYELVPIPSQYTLAQYVGTICAPYTTIKLSATINAEIDGGILIFCINPTTCSSPQNVPNTNGRFVEFSATFSIAPDASVTASLNLAANNLPIYIAGIGVFQISPA